MFTIYGRIWLCNIYYCDLYMVLWPGVKVTDMLSYQILEVNNVWFCLYYIAFSLIVNHIGNF